MFGVGGHVFGGSMQSCVICVCFLFMCLCEYLLHLKQDSVAFFSHFVSFSFKQ